LADLLAGVGVMDAETATLGGDDVELAAIALGGEIL
jgi:hypothetical protein